MTKTFRTYNKKIIIDKEFARKLKEYEKLKNELEPIIKETKIGLLETMQQLGKTSVVSNGIAVSLVNGYTRKSIDGDLLKKEQNDIYNKYLKETSVASTIKMKVED